MKPTVRPRLAGRLAAVWALGAGRRLIPQSVSPFPFQRRLAMTQCPIGSASFVGDNRVVFTSKGNDYRLIVLAEYGKGKLFIRFVGTHAEYDRIDASTI